MAKASIKSDIDPIVDKWEERHQSRKLYKKFFISTFSILLFGTIPLVIKILYPNYIGDFSHEDYFEYKTFGDDTPFLFITLCVLILSFVGLYAYFGEKASKSDYKDLGYKILFGFMISLGTSVATLIALFIVIYLNGNNMTAKALDWLEAQHGIHQLIEDDTLTFEKDHPHIFVNEDGEYLVLAIVENDGIVTFTSSTTVSIENSEASK